MIAAKCPCGAKLKAPDGSLGKNGKCPHCGTSFPIVPWLLCADSRADVIIDADGRFTCNSDSRGSRRRGSDSSGEKTTNFQLTAGRLGCSLRSVARKLELIRTAWAGEEGGRP